MDEELRLRGFCDLLKVIWLQRGLHQDSSGLCLALQVHGFSSVQVATKSWSGVAKWMWRRQDPGRPQWTTGPKLKYLWKEEVTGHSHGDPEILSSFPTHSSNRQPKQLIFSGKSAFLAKSSQSA